MTGDVPACAPEIKMRRVAHIGARWEMVCPCGAKSPLASREVAEGALDEHTGVRR